MLLCSNIEKFVQQKIMRYLPDQKKNIIVAASHIVATAWITPKIS